MALLKKKKKSAGPQIPTVKLEIHPDSVAFLTESDNPYVKHGYSFAPASKIVKGTCRQLYTFGSCRDGYLSRLKNHHAGNSSFLDGYSTEKTTLMIHTSLGKANPDSGNSTPEGQSGNYHVWLAESVKAAVQIINAFERDAGWLRTKAYKAILPKKSKADVHVFEGSRWWSTSTHTLSMFMLLIRLGKRHEIKALGFKPTIDEVLTVLAKIEGRGLDSYSLTNTNLWRILVKKRKKVYGNRKFSTNFSSVNSGNDGLRALVTHSSSDTVAQERFKELCRGV